MQDKNNFDDLILGKSNKSEKIKKILLRVIALVILFLVVMIVMKLINSGEERPSQTLFPPEPGSDTGFQDIPVMDNATELDDFARLRQIMQGGDDSVSLEDNQTSSFVAPLPQEPVATPKPQADPKSESKPAVATPQVATPKPESKPVVAPQVATPKPPVATPKPEPKPESKPVASQKPAPTNPEKLFEGANLSDQKLSAGSYIQIFSVSNFDPKSRELALIEQNGYKYKLYKTKLNDKDITRVLVGPFTKDELQNELKKVQEKIKKEAFVFQIK